MTLSMTPQGTWCRSDPNLLQWSDNNVHHTSKWVQGHQCYKKKAEDLTNEEQMNIKMDWLADIAYELPYEMQKWSDQDVLPAETITVYIQGNKITFHLKKAIIHACHTPAMESYIIHKHNLNVYDMDHINWRRLNSLMTKQKMNQWATSAKLIQGWLPTNIFLHKTMNNLHHFVHYATIYSYQKHLTMS